MTRYFSSPPFTVLVANPATGRTGFRNQLISDSSGNAHMGLMTGSPTNSTGAITIVNADFTVSDLYATGGFLVTLPMTAGVEVVINGNTLVGVAIARTPGNGDFNVLAADVGAEIVAALTDALNAFDTDIVAARSGNFIGLTAVTAGVAGNALTLTTNDPAQVSLSGDTLLGGGQSAEQSSLRIGPYTLVTGVHWAVVVGDAGASATALAASINRLPGYTASALAAVVTVTGPASPAGSEDQTFETQYQGVLHFTLSPANGSLGGGAPTLGPPELL